MKRGTISADAFNAAYARLKKAEAARPKEYCPKCGKRVISAKLHPEAAADMAAMGYDGTCCWPGFDKLLSPKEDKE